MRFLRHRGQPQWDKDAPEARKVRGLARLHWVAKPAQTPDQTDRTDPSDRTNAGKPPNLQALFGPYTPWLTHADPAIIANTLLCLIHQANYLLGRQILALEKGFVKEGGYSEQLAAARIAERERRRGQTGPAQAPNCPLCGKPMALRTARKGKHAGSQFWGCTGYPVCKGIRPLESGGPKTDRTDPTDPTDPSP